MPTLGQFPAAVNFADSDLPVGTVVVTFAVAAISLAGYILYGLSGESVAEQEEQEHGEEEERVKLKRRAPLQEPSQRAFTWDIGRRIIDTETSCWLSVGILLKVLMGAPAPLQVLALSDAARGMARGGDEGYQEFVTAIGNCFLFFCIEKLLQFLARITIIRGEFLFTQRLQRQVYTKMLQQDYEFFDGKPTAMLQNLVHDSTERVCTSLIFMRVRIIQALATVFFQVVLLTWRFPSLALVVNMSLPLAGTIRYYSQGYFERAGARLKARGNIVGQRTWDVLSNLPTVRAHCREPGAVEDYARCMAYQARVTMQLHMFNGISQPFLHFCDMICVYLGYYYGGHLVRMGSLTTAELMTVIRQFQTVSSELTHMLDTIANSMLTTEHARDLLELLESRPKIEPELVPCGGGKAAVVYSHPLRSGEGNPQSGSTSMEVEFHEVTFTYPGAVAQVGKKDARILRGLSFVARDGEFTALVGRTGCGKSTVTLLMQRLYDVSAGTVLVGGVDVREQDVRQLRRKIAVVSQDPVLFSTSIYQNLLYALQDTAASLSNEDKEQRMVEACRRADIWEFIDSLPDGLRTNVGPRGSQLSGGQKQRLTIARAILKDAPLLVLDEATSSLDVEAERSVQQALDHLIGEGGINGRRATRLVVAHRLSTIRHADKIVAIAGGKVAEEGTHNELVAKEDGIYARFVRLSIGGDAELSPAAVSEAPPAPEDCQDVFAAPAAAAEAALRRAYADLRESWAAFHTEFAGAGGATARALAAEVERCQQRLGVLIEGRSGCRGD